MKPETPGGPDSPPGLQHPGRWLWLFLFLPVVLGLARLHLDVEVFDLLPPDLKVVQGLKLYQQHFANARELIVTLRAPTTEAAENAARVIAQQLLGETNLVNYVTWQPPWLEHPEQAAELLAFLWFNQPPEAFSTLADRLAPEKLASIILAAREELATSLSPQQIARLSYDPYGLTRLPESISGAAPSFGQGHEGFASTDGKFRLLFIQSKSELRSYRDCEEWLEGIKHAVNRKALVQLQGSGEILLGFTGRPAFVAEIATSMERDMITSVGGTAAIIAGLFWLAHRRLKPMLWLLLLLALILGCTLALGGLIFGTINVVSMGFAAILLGLAVDYAVVHYQEALTHPQLSIPQIRHAIAPSIFWAALTTISAFLVLNFAGLPGLGQLGSLVGLGVGLAALIMVFEFLPPLFPSRKLVASPSSEVQVTKAPTSNGRPWTPMWIGSITVLLTSSALAVLAFGLPQMDPTANALRPVHSPAYDALAQIQAHLNREREPLWLIVGGHTEEDVAQRLERAELVLSQAVSNNLIDGFTLPSPLWPKPSFQQINRATAARLVTEREAIRSAALTNGFSERALFLADRILDTWKLASEGHTVFWPTNPTSRWVYEKISARTPTNNFAFGLVTSHLGDGRQFPGISEVESRLPREQVWLSGWGLLGSAIFSQVSANLWKVVVPMMLLVMSSLYLAFRSVREIGLSLAALSLSALCLLGVMRLVGWSWNLMNLMAIPLVLGTGVDYSIFMLLALKRYEGDLSLAYRSVGRALLLCGGTAAAGFGSLSWSANAGMASLGRVCSVGIGANMLIAIFLLPRWWLELKRRADARRSGQPLTGTANRPTAPSVLYSSLMWRVGLRVVRALPTGLCVGLSCFFAKAYWFLAWHRRKVVINNLLPALGGDYPKARQKAKQLFQQFGVKLVDLWRYEAGQPIDDLFGEATGWEHFLQAKASGRGVLLVTPHLGNWEFGGPMLSRRGLPLQVLTLAEPGKHFTKLRQASRARWNIETLVIQDDPFAFLEVIRRLESGATVALLIDRPPAPTSVPVNLFGRPFRASIAAAELARASGCAILPVYLPRAGGRYSANILPPIRYDRGVLRDRHARIELTQQVVHAFEPLILRHLDQWYHFVPIWGEGLAQNKKLIS